ncbi:putative Nitric oxide synthase-interacting protein [Hibiscus syriacus]|uniref:Nitric oxide synthase-interacting protein n=1 Tax=Hibiscus syriacus TaxID=106335 RepID=A0A6A2ZQ11_HIBSY|nr:uncharacterized protein LOC120141864 [Hibiscus syriacus]KAE8693222.1 putative Nitric oxide synthase-interacting protein [Hibiscus syriacus]
MEKNIPVRKSDRSTADMLSWTQETVSSFSNATAHRSSARSNQPSDGISKVVFGGRVTDDEAQSLLKKKPWSGNKMKEMSGSGIFGSNDTPEPTSRSHLRMYQEAVNGVSQISLGGDGSVPAKKPTSLPAIAKQRELSGTLRSQSDSKHKRQISSSKYKELSGHDIFAPPDGIKPPSLATQPKQSSGESVPRNVPTSVKVSNPAGGQKSIQVSGEPVIKTAKKIHNHKLQELTGNGIFKEDVGPGSGEKPLSRAKLREMSGNNIFSDGKVESRDHLGGVRKPPGGGSSIYLF